MKYDLQDIIEKILKEDKGLSEEMIAAGLKLHRELDDFLMELMPSLVDIMTKNYGFISQAEKYSDMIMETFLRGIAMILEIEDGKIREANKSPKH